MKDTHAMALLKLINDLIPNDYDLSEIQTDAIVELTERVNPKLVKPITR